MVFGGELFRDCSVRVQITGPHSSGKGCDSGPAFGSHIVTRQDVSVATPPENRKEATRPATTREDAIADRRDAGRRAAAVSTWGLGCPQRRYCLKPPAQFVTTVSDGVDAAPGALMSIRKRCPSAVTSY